MPRDTADQRSDAIDAFGTVAACIASGASRDFVMRLITRSTRQLVDCDIAVVALLEPGDDLVTVAHTARSAIENVALGPTLFVPIGVGAPRGWLCASRVFGLAPFTTDELEVVQSFAAHAGLVLERDLGRRRVEEQQRITDQWRLARDLQALAGEHLSRISFRLSGLLAEIGDERTRDRIVHSIDDLDHAGKLLRQIAFGLRDKTKETP